MRDGILLIDKAAGVTSRKVDNLIQKKFGTRKVGHLGTLDPFATGLLLVCVNKASKFLQFIEDGRKTYIASLKLGVSTSTGDKDGEVTCSGGKQDFALSEINEALASFLGKGSQIPPMTSAIKVDGEALYKKAHKGIEIERAPRPIEVYEIKLIRFEEGTLDFLVTVSAGTYIRVLGEDIAKKLGTVGHLTALRRIAIGKIGIHHAKPIEEISEVDLLNPSIFVTGMDKVEVDESDEKRIKNGLPLCLEGKSDKVLLLYKGEALAVYQKDGRLYKCVRGLF